MQDTHAYNQQLIQQFRTERDQTGQPLDGRPVLLLTTTGARSGHQHTTPLMYIPHGKRLLIIASNIGAPRHPAWYHNLVAHPQVTIEVGPDTFNTTAVVLKDEQRQQVWDQIIEDYPFFAEHQLKTTRIIPIIVLTQPTE